MCDLCHKKELYEKKVIHKVLSQKGCLALPRLPQFR